jgi:hypothetical protein
VEKGDISDQGPLLTKKSRTRKVLPVEGEGDVWDMEAHCGEWNPMCQLIPWNGQQFIKPPTILPAPYYTSIVVNERREINRVNSLFSPLKDPILMAAFHVGSRKPASTLARTNRNEPSMPRNGGAELDIFDRGLTAIET